MRRTLTLLSVLLVAGCDTFGTADALPPLGTVATEPALLRLPDRWVAVSAVSDGRPVAFPDSGFSVSFGPSYVSGRTWANAFGGDYEANSDGSFETGSVITTLVGQSREIEAFQAVLHAELRGADRFAVEGASLQLRSADGDGILLRAESD